MSFLLLDSVSVIVNILFLCKGRMMLNLIYYGLRLMKCLVIMVLFHWVFCVVSVLFMIWRMYLLLRRLCVRIRLFCGCVFWMVRIEKMVFGRCVVISDFSGLCLMVSVGVMWLIVCCVCVCVWWCRWNCMFWVWVM